jgi:membrane protease YdiL (CAAX protease family)
MKFNWDPVLILVAVLLSIVWVILGFLFAVFLKKQGMDGDWALGIAILLWLVVSAIVAGFLVGKEE